MTDYSLASIIGDTFAARLPHEQIANRLGILGLTESPDAFRELINQDISVQELESLVDSLLEQTKRYLGEIGIRSKIINIRNEISVRFEVNGSSELLRFNPKPTRPVLRINFKINDGVKDEIIEYYLDPYQDLIFSSQMGEFLDEASANRISFSNLARLTRHISAHSSEAVPSLTPQDEHKSPPNLSQLNIPYALIQTIDSPTNRVPLRFRSIDALIDEEEESEKKSLLDSSLRQVANSKYPTIAFIYDNQAYFQVYNSTHNKAVVINIPMDTLDFSKIKSTLSDLCKRILNITSGSTEGWEFNFEIIDLEDSTNQENEIDKAVHMLEVVSERFSSTPTSENAISFLSLVNSIESQFEISLEIDFETHRAICDYIELAQDCDPTVCLHLISFYTNCLISTENINYQDVNRELIGFACAAANLARDRFPNIPEFSLYSSYLELIKDNSEETNYRVISCLESQKDDEIANHPAYFRCLSIAYSRIGDLLRASDSHREYLRLTQIRLYFFSRDQRAWWNTHYEEDIANA